MLAELAAKFLIFIRFAGTQPVIDVARHDGQIKLVLNRAKGQKHGRGVAAAGNCGDNVALWVEVFSRLHQSLSNFGYNQCARD
jgi:hypothetical protein